jgi:hypothetical protein
MAGMNKNDVNKYLSSRGKTYERSSNLGGHGNVKSYRDLPNNSNNTTDRMMTIRDTRMNKNNINNYLSSQQDHYSTIHYDKPSANKSKKQSGSNSSNSNGGVYNGSKMFTVTASRILAKKKAAAKQNTKQAAKPAKPEKPIIGRLWSDVNEINRIRAGKGNLDIRNKWDSDAKKKQQQDSYNTTHRAGLLDARYYGNGNEQNRARSAVNQYTNRIISRVFDKDEGGNMTEPFNGSEFANSLKQQYDKQHPKPKANPNEKKTGFEYDNQDKQAKPNQTALAKKKAVAAPKGSIRPLRSDNDENGSNPVNNNGYTTEKPISTIKQGTIDSDGLNRDTQSYQSPSPRQSEPNDIGSSFDDYNQASDTSDESNYGSNEQNSPATQLAAPARTAQQNDEEAMQSYSPPAGNTELPINKSVRRPINLLTDRVTNAAYSSRPDVVNNQPSYQNSQTDNSSEDNNEYRYGGYMYAGGGGINIKPSHEGLFSQAAKAHGMSVQQYAASILRNKDNHNATLIKRANFARNAAGWSHAEGGYLNDEDNIPDGGMNDGNTNLNNYGYGITRYGVGGSHEQNKNGGIQQGIAPDGQPNLVEQGEVRYNNYVYSNRLTPNKHNLKINNLPTNYAGKTFAKIAESLSKEVQERPNDPISLAGLESMMTRLRNAQEVHKQVKDVKLDPETMNAIKSGSIDARGTKYLDI